MKTDVIKKILVIGIIILFIGTSITPTTGNRVLEKRIPKDDPPQAIDGLYYLRDDDPGNMTDVGSLLRDAPLENEVTFCGAFIVFHFAEEGTYPGINRIFNIYYRIWQKTPELPVEGEIFGLGYTTSGGHGGPLNESITINTSECISVVDNYRLVQAMQYTNPEIAFFEGDNIYNFSILSVGNGPRIRTHPNQYSFVILNLEDNATLQGYDRDRDYLNDYDELFVYVTNPFDNDTDDDGLSDYEECMGGSDPNNYTDPLGSDTTPPSVTINFAGNLSDKGGPYWRPPEETVQLADIWSDGYYTNDSRQLEDWIYINLTVIDIDSSIDRVWLQWLNDTTWTNWTYEFTHTVGDYWEFNSSGIIETAKGNNYSFDIVANDTRGNSKVVEWNKTGPTTGFGHSVVNYTRRYVQLGCTLADITYTPFYCYEAFYILSETGDDRLHHDQGGDGSEMDTGYLLSQEPTDDVALRMCGGFIGYWFDESSCIERFDLSNIYYHIWWSANDSWGKRLGYTKQRTMIGTLLENFSIDRSKARSNITYDNGFPNRNNNYSLETHLFEITPISFTDNDIYEFNIQLYGLTPSIINNRSFTSFVFLNVPDNATLNATYPDSDGDSLSDWEELYVTYTSPFLADTDNDGATDYDEYLGGSDPNNYTDWNYRPNTPITPSGPAALEIGQPGTYSTSTTDPDGDQVSYQFDWDADGAHDYSDWTNLVDSGQTVYKSHIWNSPGIYTVNARVQDEHGATSEWSSGCTVTISDTYCWPMFRQNPKHTGFSSSSAPNTNNTLWINITGDLVRSSPSVVDDNVYFGTFASYAGKVLCLNASDGIKRWEFSTDDAVYSSPAVIDGMVYIGSYDGKVYCLNASDGTKEWEFVTNARILSSPTVVDGKVFIGSDDGSVYALPMTDIDGNGIIDLPDWSYQTGGPVESSPAVVGGRVYIGSNDGNVYCFYASNGTVDWTFPTDSDVRSSPSVVNGSVYIGSDDGNMYCINASDGQEIWRNDTGVGLATSSPAVAYDRVYFGTLAYDGKVFCLDAADGSFIWEYATNCKVETSPAVADGKVYLGLNWNEVCCLNASDGEVIWNYSTEGFMMSSPAVADGKLFIGSDDGKVYAFEDSTLKRLSKQKK